MTSKIEWTNETWNPVTGCSKVSEGCKHCYAEREWARLSANPKTVYHGRKFTDVMVHPERLDQPLRWKKPRMIFVNSMSDLFHESVPDETVLGVWNTMRRSPQHIFQILTKRPERMRDLVPRIRFENTGRMWLAEDPTKHEGGYSLGAGHLGCTGLENVWLGVSVEDQKTADERIPLLLQTSSAVRFVSYEPALGPVDLSRWVIHPRLDWVIAGGESGPKARPSHPDWFREVRDQCQAAGVPFFFKQWGEWVEGIEFNELGIQDDPEISRFDSVVWGDDSWETCGPCWDQFPDVDGPCDDPIMFRVGKKRAGRKLDGREWNEYPGGGV